MDGKTMENELKMGAELGADPTERAALPPGSPIPVPEAEVVSILNDLLQLDHDALSAYSVAIATLKNAEYRERLRTFRSDHERHVLELSELIKNRGATPINVMHLPTGVFKLALQGAAGLGGDMSVLVSFKANERQVRDKYRRYAFLAFPEDVSPILNAAAADEEKHYAWVTGTLNDLGYDPESTMGKFDRGLERAHKGMADAVEEFEKKTRTVMHGGSEKLIETAKKNPIGSAAVALGAGLFAAALGRKK
ncbi:MAG: ferritin-like domain-containing protein [Gemmatimonadaceae bacterium]|nr:ferritin-like domain-containing protein [Gemmatimonadaceae bacterium]